MRINCLFIKIASSKFVCASLDGRLPLASYLEVYKLPCRLKAPCRQLAANLADEKLYNDALLYDHHHCQESDSVQIAINSAICALCLYCRMYTYTISKEKSITTTTHRGRMSKLYVALISTQFVDMAFN